MLLKNLAFGLGKALFAIVLIFGIFIGYSSWADGSASKKANEFCQDVSLGNPSEQLFEKAVASGADIRQTNWYATSGEADTLSATFTGAFPFSRYICIIKARGGRVEAKEVQYLD